MRGLRLAGKAEAQKQYAHDGDNAGYSSQRSDEVSDVHRIALEIGRIPRINPVAVASIRVA